MSRSDEARALLAEGRKEEAAALLEAAAAADDAGALSMLADWRIYGLEGPQDKPAGYRLLERAAALGDEEAAAKLAYLTAAGIGCEADLDRAREMLGRLAERDDYARLQLRLLAAMPGPGAAAKAARRLLCESPRIELVKTLFSAEECRYLVSLAEPRLQPALIVDPATGQAIPKPVRTASGMTILATQEDLVVHAVNRRLAEATGTHFSWGEPLNILRYTPGQEYRPHHDALPNVANQRVCTALIYLNSGFEGGETSFPLLGVSGRGGVGDVLIFWNLLDDGGPDERSCHAGLPVASGVKWLASRWIRQGPFDHCLSSIRFDSVVQ